MKNSIVLIAAMMLICFASPLLAAEGQSQGHRQKMIGEIVKVEGSLMTIKDKKGKTRQFRINQSTRVKGAVKMGSQVTVEASKSGRALSVHARHE